MTLILSNSFSSSFANIPSLQGLNTNVAGSSSPSGISGALDIVDGVFRATINTTDPETFGGIRSECVFDAQAINDEIWITFEMKVKSSEWAAGADEISLFQIHQKDSITSAVNFISLLKNGYYDFKVPNYALPATGNQGNFRVASRVKFPFDVWNKVAFHAKWVNAATGFRELFFNREKVFNEWLVGTAYTSDAPYPKLGLYDAFNTLTSTRKAYFKNFNLYIGTEAYTTVLDGAPKAKRMLVG